MPALAYHGAGMENMRSRRREIIERFRRACRFVTIHLSARPANLIAIGFALVIPDFGETRRISTPRRGGGPPLRDILLAAAVDMSKRRIRYRPPAHKAAQCRPFHCASPDGSRHEARHPCVVKTS
jgi:hypothetical protein